MPQSKDIDFFSDHSGIKLEIGYREKSRKSTSMCRLANMLLKNQWVNEEVKEEIRKYLETDQSGNTTFQNRWDALKAVLKGKFIVI